jgi:uncharacterized membrane protein
MARRPHGFVYALLAVSLAVNLIGAGYYLGSGFMDYRSAKRTKPPRTVETTIDAVSRRYPAPVNELIRAKLEAKRDEIKVAIDEMNAARRETRQAVRQDPLDRERLVRSFESSREKLSAFQRLIHGAIIEALPDVPQAERGALEKDEDAE